MNVMNLFQFVFGVLLGSFSFDGGPIKHFNDKQKMVTVSDLQGLWSHNKLTQNFTNCSGFVSEKIISPLHGTTDLYIENDTMWTLQYPCKLNERRCFFVQHDSLYIQGSTVAFGYLQMNNNVLSITFPNCAEHYFTRGTANTEAIKSLKRDTINSLCLLNKYKIITHFEPDDEASFDNIPPVKMPTHIKVTSDQLASIKQRMITLKVRNKDRLFYITQINFYGFYPNMKTRFILSPASWWKGDFFEVFYLQE